MYSDFPRVFVNIRAVTDWKMPLGHYKLEEKLTISSVDWVLFTVKHTVTLE